MLIIRKTLVDFLQLINVAAITTNVQMLLNLANANTVCVTTHHSQGKLED